MNYKSLITVAICTTIAGVSTINIPCNNYEKGSTTKYKTIDGKTTTIVSHKIISNNGSK